jgi:2-methylcitrate dehydratase PrpD
MSDTKPTQGLAEFISHLSWLDLPAAVQHAARRNLVNILACALGGRADPAITAFSSALAPMSGAPVATEIGARATDAGTAAFLNAAAANVQDFDDQHLPTVMHPGPVVVAAALAAAELAGANGQQLLTAIVAGIEVACRIGNAVSPGHYAAGFHITATCGVFGAAAAAASVLRLDTARVVWAMGHAAGQSAGLVEALGAGSKSTSVGAAARGGVQAALFARAGIAGPSAPLEGRFGFLSVMGRAADSAPIVGELGLRWEVLRNAPKAYPVGVVLHPVVDACLALRAQKNFALDRVSRLELYGNPMLRLRADRPDIRTGREASVSAQHVAAAALLTGRVGPAELTDVAVENSEIKSFRDRIFVSDDADCPVEAVTLIAKGDGVAEWRVHVPMARGLPDRPLDDDALNAKARLLIRWGSPWCDADVLLQQAWRTNELPGLGPLSAALRYGGPRRIIP